MLGRAGHPLHSLLSAVGWDDAPVDRLTIVERPKVLATPWPIAPMAAAALGAVGLAVSRILEIRTGRIAAVGLDTRAAELAMASSSYLMLDGRPAKFRDPFTGFYPAADGKWVYLHGNFPHLRDALLDMLSVRNDPDAVRSAVAARSASDIEVDAIRRGLCAARVRSREAWLGERARLDPAGGQPISLRRLAEAPRKLLGSTPGGPLEGARMLDLSRVIAGPMAGRTMAEHGASVLRIASANLPSIPSLVIDTGFGKRSAFIDLDTAEGREQLQMLAHDADVYLDAYRPGSLGRRGFGLSDLTAINPELVSLSLSAFSEQGTWRLRRGYDSLVQATTGMAIDDASPAPALLPCQPLDYLSGYLAAFAAMVALIRRHETGGRWHAAISLAGTAEWMWRMRAELGDDSSYPERNPEQADAADLMDGFDTDFGHVAALRPALLFDGRPRSWDRLPVPLGTHEAIWPER
ncbi:acyl-CoA transferase [Pseudorhizobium endolithicum]|uniref:Acyl-CoA transferase n=1 Tax=Pseudorhizobium endolithicum TaxID=1191678 RepID=A0ABN7JHA8_9HYPH|nr:CoA transferase [Pseudorhizobium endolithicum]CAD7031087.1 acyl-CoA transferase [Pseudorhizobium endolithicum]